MRGKHMQGDGPYPEQIGIPISESLRGLSTFTIVYDEKNNALAFVDDFVDLKTLKSLGYLKENPLIKKFEETRNQVKIRVQKEKL